MIILRSSDQKVLLSPCFYLCFFISSKVQWRYLFFSMNFFVHDLYLIAVYSTFKRMWFIYIKMMKKDGLYHFGQRFATKNTSHFPEMCRFRKYLLKRKRTLSLFFNLSRFLWLWVWFCTSLLRIELWFKISW